MVEGRVVDYVFDSWSLSLIVMSQMERRASFRIVWHESGCHSDGLELSRGVIQFAGIILSGVGYGKWWWSNMVMILASWECTRFCYWLWAGDCWGKSDIVCFPFLSRLAWTSRVRTDRFWRISLIICDVGSSQLLCCVCCEVLEAIGVGTIIFL